MIDLLTHSHTDPLSTTPQEQFGHAQLQPDMAANQLQTEAEAGNPR